ncbi:MAG: AtpZ/AtpI family protein [Rhizobium sp.]|nr:AtpZ/AtpI family protein [Rhizobium sp.]
MDSLEERRKRLEEGLEHVQPKDEGAGTTGQDSRAGYNQALRISSEFIAAVIVGGLIGYLLDTFLPTKPWGLVFFVLIGFVAGVMNVLRVTGKVTSPHPVDRIGQHRNRDKR